MAKIEGLLNDLQAKLASLARDTMEATLSFFYPESATAEESPGKIKAAADSPVKTGEDGAVLARKDNDDEAEDKKEEEEVEEISDPPTEYDISTKEFLQSKQVKKEEDVRRRYEVSQFLGWGTYSSVYSVRDTHTGKVLAMKRNIYTDDIVSFLGREIRVLSEKSFQSSPFLLTLVDWFLDDANHIYSFTEHHFPGDVDHAVSRKYQHRSEAQMPIPILQVPEVSAIVANALHALKLVHSKKIVHCDVKPENLLLDIRSRTVRLADFGSCIIVGANEVRKPYGTILFMAPELLSVYSRKGEAASYPIHYGIDVWALGVTVIWLLEGKLKFLDCVEHEIKAIKPEVVARNARALDAAIEFDKIREEIVIRTILESPKIGLSPDTINVLGSSHDVIDFIQRCLQKDPSQRADLDELVRHPFVSHFYEELKKKRPAQRGLDLFRVCLSTPKAPCIAATHGKNLKECTCLDVELALMDLMQSTAKERDEWWEMMGEDEWQDLDDHDKRLA